METNFFTRKPNRLMNYDYSAGGAYFLTICAKERRNYFWDRVGATIGRPQDVPLTSYGRALDQAIHNITVTYPSVSVEEYVIMPDHFHLLLIVYTDMNGRPMVAPTMSRLVQQLKGVVTKEIGESIWQKSYFDHVIRNGEDYDEHVRYIYNNPLRWQSRYLNTDSL